jgi:hypothetical protein
MPDNKKKGFEKDQQGIGGEKRDLGKEHQPLDEEKKGDAGSHKPGEMDAPKYGENVKPNMK